MKHLQRIGREQVLLLGIILLFLWVRAPSIWHHEVIFTYDQARDFLAGARIIIDKNPVFIGPTTGIGGLFHGAWWYYFTAVIYLFFWINTDQLLPCPSTSAFDFTNFILLTREKHIWSIYIIVGMRSYCTH
jgi:hypothetical protein